MILRRLLLSGLTVLALGIPQRTGAQFTTAHRIPVSVDIGSRVRVGVRSTHPQPPFGSRVEQWRGTVSGLTPDTLYLDIPNTVGTVPIPRASIRRVERSTGPPSVVASILEVGLVGAALGAVRMVSAHQDPKSRQFDSTLEAAAAGAALGFIIGGYFGGRRPFERWRPARLPD